MRAVYSYAIILWNVWTMEYPGSLSARVHEILRSDLGFSGVIMTDDLYMDAVRDEYGARRSGSACRTSGK